MRVWWTLLALVGCSKGATPDIAPIALTPTEYNNTVRDLLGMPLSVADWPDAHPVSERLSPASGAVVNAFFGEVAVAPWPWPLPPEVGVDAFDGMVQGQSSSAYQLEELQKAAVHFGGYTLVSPEFFVCADWASLRTAEQEACAWNSLSRFAQRAWRRPITATESVRLHTFYMSNVKGGPLDEAVALTAAGILQTPQFLFRMESGEPIRRHKGRVQLTDWELASRLSYFLWDSMPDQALFQAAEDGALSSRSGIQEQVERMLGDRRAQDAVVRFHTLWLETDGLSKITPAQRAYGPVYGLDPNPGLDTTDDGAWPTVLGELRTAMRAETHLFVASTLFDGAGTFQDLMGDHHGYLADITVPIYGSGAELLDLPPQTWELSFVAASQGKVGDTLTLFPATFPRNERAGLLTLPSVLALGAHPVHPSPVLRGKRILERVTCATVEAPPPGVEGLRPPDTVQAESTNRARTQAATSPEPCLACHARMNSAGFAFEHYDSLGRYRTEDNGQPVDAGGVFLAGSHPLAFRDGVDLARQLSTHPVVLDCYARRWTDYALGYATDPADPDVARILQNFREDDHVLTLLAAIATSEMFRYRAVGGGG